MAPVRGALRRDRARPAGYEPGPRASRTAELTATPMSTPPGMSRAATAAGTLARYGFADAGRAEALLQALHLWDGTAPADPVAEPILDALAQAADPDLALRQLHRLAARAPEPGLAT